MMMRVLLMICMMIGLMMPCAWAEESSAPFEIPAEFQEAWNHVQNGTDATISYPQEAEKDPDMYYLKSGIFDQGTPLPINSPLTKLRIETEDWVEDSTYYVRHTITNPTDETIVKDIDYINIKYQCFVSQTDECVRWNQHSDAVRKLSLAPHSSCSFIVPLTIKDPFDFIYLDRSTLYFTDGSNLDYLSEYDRALPQYFMTPIILPSGEVYIAIKNHHPTQTITDIRNVYLSASFQKNSSKHDLVQFKYMAASPLPIQVKPQETGFFRLPKSFTEINSDLSLYSTSLDISINGIRHAFDLSSLFEPRVYRADQYTYSPCYYTPSIFDKHGLNSVEASGTYETDDTTLYGYLRVKNPHDKPIYLPLLNMDIFLHYYNANNIQEGELYQILFLTPTTLAPYKERFLSFTIPLPQNAAHTLRITKSCLWNGTYRYKPSENTIIHHNPNLALQKLSPLQKALYKPALKTVFVGIL